MTGTNWSLRRRLGSLVAIAAVLLLVLVSFASVILVQVHRDQDDVTNRYFTILSDSNVLFLGLILIQFLALDLHVFPATVSTNITSTWQAFTHPKQLFLPDMTCSQADSIPH